MEPTNEPTDSPTVAYEMLTVTFSISVDSDDWTLDSDAFTLAIADSLDIDSSTIVSVTSVNEIAAERPKLRNSRSRVLSTSADVNVVFDLDSSQVNLVNSETITNATSTIVSNYQESTGDDISVEVLAVVDTSPTLAPTAAPPSAAPSITISISVTEEGWIIFSVVAFVLIFASIILWWIDIFGCYGVKDSQPYQSLPQQDSSPSSH